MDKPSKETLTIEFKSDKKCLPMDDLYKEVVAMANTDGGIICLGINHLNLSENGIMSCILRLRGYSF